MITAYKVVRQREGRLESCIARMAPQVKGATCGKVYRQGKVARAHPDSLGIFCFTTLLAASNFIRTDLGQRIHKVQTFGKGARPPRIQPSFRTYFGLGEKGTQAPPYGTICFPAIRLLEQIPPI